MDPQSHVGDLNIRLRIPKRVDHKIRSKIITHLKSFLFSSIVDQFIRKSFFALLELESTTRAIFLSSNVEVRLSKSRTSTLDDTKKTRAIPLWVQ